MTTIILHDPTVIEDDIIMDWEYYRCKFHQYLLDSHLIYPYIPHRAYDYENIRHAF